MFLCTKEELAAMAFTAYRTKAEVQPSAVEKILQSREQCKKRLLLPNGSEMEDPLKVTSGWIGEEKMATTHI